MHDQAWSWVGEDGVEHRGSENRLTDALASGRLAPYTLVTKPEWRDWLPAMTVVELQWALPVGTADNPRRPLPRENLPKLPPPLGDYALFRQRHQNLVQYAASLPPEMPSSSGRVLPKYTSDDYDEPTVQIDAEELERALNESRGDEGSFKRGPGSPPARSPEASSAASAPGTLEHKPLNRAALAQRLALTMPTHPGYVPNPPSIPPAPSPVRGKVAPNLPSAPPAPRGPSISSPGSSPISSQPGPLAFDSHPPPPAFGSSQLPPQHKPLDNTSGFGGHEPTMTSRLDSVLPPSHHEALGRRRSGLWLAALVIIGAVAGAFLFQARSSDAPPASVGTTVAPVNLPIPSAQPPAAQVRSCALDNQAKVSDFAHALVRPAVSPVPGSTRVAVAFAQSGKIATGVTLDPISLSVTPHYSENQNSPVWSVAPITTGNALKFQTSRAASTLRSTTTLPAATPLVVGLNRDHIAGRTASDVVDRLIWKSDWDTISSPDWAQLDPTTFVLAFRGGGERGKVVVGRLSDTGKPLGPLSIITAPSPRVEAPFITIHDTQVLVTFAGGDKPLRDKVLIATSKRDALPTEARELLTVPEGVTSPQLVPLEEGGFALQYTRGVAGKQQVVSQVFTSELKPVGEPFLLSATGKDAYEGYAFRHNQQAFVLYFVRQPLGHELWLASLKCQR